MLTDRKRAKRRAHLLLLAVPPLLVVVRALHVHVHHSRSQSTRGLMGLVRFLIDYIIGLSSRLTTTLFWKFSRTRQLMHTVARRTSSATALCDFQIAAD